MVIKLTYKIYNIMQIYKIKIITIKLNTITKLRARCGYFVYLKSIIVLSSTFYFKSIIGIIIGCICNYLSRNSKQVYKTYLILPKYTYTSIITPC